MNKIIISPETHPLTWRCRNDKKPVWISEYEKKNGYSAVKKVIHSMNSKEIINIIKESELKGRGGAGFYTGIKWDLMYSSSSMNEQNRYLLCNADEMEPGTYKDKFIIEQLPHLLIEGIIIAAYALHANYGYIFLRGDYIKAEKCLRHAIQEAKERGYLGNRVLKSNFNFNLFVHTGAGRYICGEETALINSLEGKRANPRFKPPYPSTLGLWGKPTCVNNVETLCNIPAIISYGVSWYKNISCKYSTDTGTKLMGFSGQVNNPGIWECHFGITARELLENYANGMKKSFKLKAWLPGGASTNLLTSDHLDYSMDFESMHKVGSRLGTAIAIAVDNTINIVSLIRNIEIFFARESCGLCTPCRDGLPWSVKLLSELELGRGKQGDIEILEHICKLLGPSHSFCAHAPGAVLPLQSAIKHFRSEFEHGISTIPILHTL